MTPESFDFGQVEKLTDRLSELVRKYPKGVGIFKEFLQNADDAGATSLRVFLDLRTFPSEDLPAPAMSALQGPALVFANDKPFSKDDWVKIQEIGNSGKAMNVAKTGRFGLGFNSVYNVTDYPMLLTNDSLGIFDPHFNIVTGNSGRPGKGWRLKGLWESGSDLLAPFVDFGLSKGQSKYGATIFRLPLRNAESAAQSEIFNEPFELEDFANIVSTAEQHASGLVLFLNSIQGFEVSEISESGEVKEILSLKTANEPEVTNVKSKLRQSLAKPISEILEKLELIGSEDVFYSHQLEIKSINDQRTESWSVIRGLYDHEDLLNSAREMFEVGEKALPLAGAAIQYNLPAQHGQLSCALPLPIGSGTPLHIDGFFDLEDSRQDIHQDATTTGKTGAVRFTWNQNLLKHGCAFAAAELLTRAGESNEIPVYEHWPSVGTNSDRLVDQLPQMIYDQLGRQDCICIGEKQEFVTPSIPVNPPAKLREPLLAEGLAIPNPAIPGHVLKGFRDSKQAIASLTPEQLRENLCEKEFEPCRYQDSPLPSLRKKKWLLEILDYCLSDEDYNDFHGIPLALMADGTLRKFDPNDPDWLFIGTKAERDLLGCVPGIFLSQELVSRNGEMLPNVQSMDLTNLIEQIPTFFQTLDERDFIPTDEEFNDIPSFEWLTDFYDYCVSCAEQTGIEQMPEWNTLQSLPLVPDQDGRLFGMGLENTPVFESGRRLNTWKSELLSSANIPIVSTAGELGKAITRFKSFFHGDEIPSFSPDLVVDCIQDNPATALAWLVSSRRNIFECLNYLAGSDSTVSESSIHVLMSLPVFPLVGGGLISITDNQVYMSSGFQPPDIAFDIQLLDTNNGDLVPFFESLNVRKLTRPRFVLDFVLEGFGHVDKEDQLAALEWLRIQYYSLLTEITETQRGAFTKKVRETRLVLCEDGELHSPSEIYHPDCKEVVTNLGKAAHCPDMKVYDSDGWLEFFCALGMEQNARPRDVIAALDFLISEPFTNNVANRIHKLFKFIEKNWTAFNDKMAGENWFTESLKNRRWLPVVSTCPSNYPSSLFNSPTMNLYTPSEIGQNRDLNLIGSARPVCRFPIPYEVAKTIGLVAPDLSEVFDQFDNALATANDGKVDKQIAIVVGNVYRFAGRAIKDPDCEWTEDELATKYSEVRCLLDDSNTLWRPRDCYEAPVPFFVGMRKRILYGHEHEDHFATAIGRKRNPNVDDFLRFFEDLDKAVGDQEIPVSCRPKIRSAIRHAAELASPGEFSDSSVLSESGHLLPANSILLNDAPWIADRAANAGIELLDRELGVKDAVAFGVGQLSVVVTERIESTEECKDTALLEICESVNRTLQSPEFAKGLVRLISSSDQDQFEIEKLRRFCVMPALKIETSLYWEGELIENSRGDTNAIFEDGELFTSSAFPSLLHQHVTSTLSTRIFSDLEFVNETCIPMMLAESPQDIESLLNLSRIPDLPEGKDFDFADLLEPEEEQTEFDFVAPSDDESDELTRFESASPQTSSFPPPIASTDTTQTNGNTIGKPARRGIASGEFVSGGSGFASRDSSSENESDTKARTELDVPRPRGNQSRNRNARGRNHRAVSYAESNSSNSPLSDLKKKQRSEVDLAAIEAVRTHEETTRVPTVKEHFNEGYDIESCSKTSETVERYIEVKGLSGAWNEFGVKLTPAQIRFGSKKGEAHWLYVVEFALDPKRQVIHKIQNPVEKVTDYRFDSGWKQFCVESVAVSARVPEEGGRVEIADLGAGTITKLQPFGDTMRLTILLDGGLEKKMNYPNKNITIVD